MFHVVPALALAGVCCLATQVTRRTARQENIKEDFSIAVNYLTLQQSHYIKHFISSRF